jgi:hypothetical protein
MGKQLVNFITCGCELSAPFFVIYKPARTHAVLVIALYELLDPSCLPMVGGSRGFFFTLPDSYSD